MFADALLTALARALDLANPDEAAQLQQVCGEAEPEPEEVVIPFGCVRYQPGNRNPKIVPQMYIDGRKTTLGHYPWTKAGADHAARVRAAAVAVKEAGGDAGAIRAAAAREREAA